jgi:hypothetical protein
MVESATICIEEIVVCAAAARKAARPRRRKARPDENRVFRVADHPRGGIGVFEGLGKSVLGFPDGGDVGR